ncbi:MAG TPA: hypothetical protein PKX93_11435 [bacterium]|nr:hypothetical protein [bacterium]
MKNFSGWLMILAVVGLSAELTCAAAEKPLQHYEILYQRNIFLPQRSKPLPPTTFRSILKEPPSDPAQNIVLTGIVRHGQEYLAFFEDRSQGRVLRRKTGDQLLQGKIKEITLDFVEYAINETTVKVEIGKTLANTTPVASARAIGSAVSSLVPSTLAAPASSPAAAPVDTSTLLEQLRRRRLQELGQP